MGWTETRLAAQLPRDVATWFFGLRWSAPRLVRDRQRVTSRSVASLAHHLDLAYWRSDSAAHSLSAAQVLRSPDAYPERSARIRAADGTEPLVLVRYAGTELLLKGLAKLANASARGESSLPCVRMRPQEVSRVLAVIPARIGSTRLAEKALEDIGGLPMVCHVWRRVASSALFARVVVATDDARIAAAVRLDGGEAILTGDVPSGTHRVARTAVRLEWKGPVVNVQGDQPRVGNDALTAAIVAADRAEVGTVAAPLSSVDHGDPAVVKVLTSDGVARRFTRQAARGADQHVGIYAFAPGAIERAIRAPRTEGRFTEDLEQTAWMAAGISVAVERIAHAPMGIDTAGQLDALRAGFQAGMHRVPDRPDSFVYASTGLR